MLAVGSFAGLENGRFYLPMVFLFMSTPGDGHITTRIDERWYGSSSIFDNDAYWTRVLANRTDPTSIKLSFLSVELRAGPEAVSEISASPTGAFFRRNKLRLSRSSRSCSRP